MSWPFLCARYLTRAWKSRLSFVQAHQPPAPTCGCQLKAEKRLLTNLAAIDAADRFIGAIEGVIDALQREHGAAPRARHAGGGGVCTTR